MQVEGAGSVIPLGVMEAFGIAAESEVHPIAGGKQNAHWSVSTGESGDRVIRRYASDRTREAIAWEHELLAYAKQRGWPVAVPRRARGGSTFVTVESETFALFPLLPGAPLDPTSLAGKALKGRLLARLHHDLRHFPNDGQRPGFARAWELDVYAGQSAGMSFHQLVATFGRDHKEAGDYLRGQRFYNLRELARLGYGELPTVVTHGDFHNDHLLFEQGELSGVLDFDSACMDAAEADVATSLALECLAAPNYDSIDLRAASAFLRAYFEHRRPTEQTADIILALLRAYLLRYAGYCLGRWYATRDEQDMASVLRTAERRLPALSQQRAELKAMIVESAPL